MTADQGTEERPENPLEKALKQAVLAGVKPLEWVITEIGHAEHEFAEAARKFIYEQDAPAVAKPAPQLVKSDDAQSDDKREKSDMRATAGVLLNEILAQPAEVQEKLSKQIAALQAALAGGKDTSVNIAEIQAAIQDAISGTAAADVPETPEAHRTRLFQEIDKITEDNNKKMQELDKYLSEEEKQKRQELSAAVANAKTPEEKAAAEAALAQFDAPIAARVAKQAELEGDPNKAKTAHEVDENAKTVIAKYDEQDKINAPSKKFDTEQANRAQLQDSQPPQPAAINDTEAKASNQIALAGVTIAENDASNASLLSKGKPPAATTAMDL